MVGVGPDFYAGRDMHIVVETNYSYNLSKVILEGEVEENTGILAEIGGFTKERVIRTLRAGIFTTDKEIGDSVVAGEVIGRVGELSLKAPMGGVLRGLLRSGIMVSRGSKFIEVDHINDRVICHLIADKVMVIGEGVLKAIMMKLDI